MTYKRSFRLQKLVELVKWQILQKIAKGDDRVALENKYLPSTHKIYNAWYRALLRKLKRGGFIFKVNKNIAKIIRSGKVPTREMQQKAIESAWNSALKANTKKAKPSTKKIEEQIAKIDNDAFTEGIESAFESMGVSFIMKAIIPSDPVIFELTNKEIIDQLEERAIFIAATTTDTIMHDSIITVRKEIFEKGKTVDTVIAELESAGLSLARSQKIVNTEVQAGLGSARHEMFVRSGVKKKRWITVGDKRVRQAHSLNESEGWININKLYSNGANHPGDGPSAINCFLDAQVGIMTSEGKKRIKDIKIGDKVLTHTGQYKKVLETYLGVNCVEKNHPLTKITFGERNRYASNNLTVTNEHPFLTERGWINAGDLKEDDMLLTIGTRCPMCNQLHRYTRKFCSNSCASRSSANEQWSSEEHRKNMSEKTSKQLKREYAAGSRIPNTNKARTACVKKYGKGGYIKYSELWRIGKKACWNKTGRTSIEQKIAEELDNDEIQYKEQFPVGNRLIDFYLPEKKLFIEVDGWYWHQDKEYSNKRDVEILLKHPDHVIEHRVFGKKNEFIETYANDLLTLNHSDSYEFVAVKIKKLVQTVTKQRKRLYNFMVEDDHSYIANGIVSHNCRCIEEADLRDPKLILDVWDGS